MKSSTPMAIVRPTFGDHASHPPRQAARGNPPGAEVVDDAVRYGHYALIARWCAQAKAKAAWALEFINTIKSCFQTLKACSITIETQCHVTPGFEL